jgi:hypothetical protein
MGVSSIAKKVASKLSSIGKKVVKGGIVVGGVGIGALHHLGKKEIAKEVVRTAEKEQRDADTKKMMEDAEKAKPNYNPFMKKVDGTYATADEVSNRGIEREDKKPKDKVVGGVVDVAKGTAGVVGGVGKVGLGVVGGIAGGVKKITPNPLKKKNP